MDRISTLRSRNRFEPIKHAVVTERNNLWLPRIRDLVQSASEPTLVLVGAAHLGGADGLVSQLAACGLRPSTRRYSQFIFLTNWSEAFDGTNAFLLYGSPGLRILFQLRTGEKGSVAITKSGLVDTIEGLLRWIAAETPRGAIQ